MGRLHPSQAIGAIAATAYRLDRTGKLDLGPDGSVEDAIRMARHLLRQSFQASQRNREAVRYRVSRVARRMLESNATVQSIWAEAHNVNGEAGFPLTEDEVKQEVIAEAAAVVRNRKMEARTHGR